jgi:two-component system sensor histidine kinase UhpB
MTGKKIRVLILEDQAQDAELMVHEMEKAGIRCLWKRVDTKEAFKKEIVDFLPDAVLSDFQLPRFDGLSALGIIREAHAHLPFILVSGAIGEEKAIEIFKKGATDYVLKSHLSRLPPAVKRALSEAEEKEGRRKAEAALQKSYHEMERRVQERTTQLAKANEELKKEIEQRKKFEIDLQKARDSLEDEVEDRTRLWIEANKALLAEIAERKEAERIILTNREELRALNAELIRIEENERQRMATALHDGLGQTLAMTRIKIDAAKSQAENFSLVESLEQVRALVDLAIKETRSLMSELSPPVLRQFGLAAALEALVEEIQEKYGLAVVLRRDDLEHLDDDVRDFLYRSIRELLMNTVKHARAGKAEISLCDESGVIAVDVRDDGIGFDASKTGRHATSRGGFGLFSIRERISHFGGNLTVESAPTKGTSIAMKVPTTLKKKRTKELGYAYTRTSR